MSAEQLAAIIAGAIIIAAVVPLIIREVRAPRPDPDSYLINALREAYYETRREIFAPYALKFCQHPFADKWPDGRVICYQCGHGLTP